MISEYVDEIKEKNLPVIVEGIKDKNALKMLGIKRIIFLNKPLFEIVESIKEKEVVILTDFDSEGKKLYSKLKNGLARNGVNVNDKLRKFLFFHGLSHVESITKFLEKRNNL